MNDFSPKHTIPATRICGQPSKDNDPCANHTTAWFEGVGWRCRFHKPEGEQWPHERRGLSDRESEGLQPLEPPDPPPNDGEMETHEDAQALIRWAARESTKGRIPESRSRAVVAAAKAFIIALKQGQESERGKRIEDGMIKSGLLKPDNR